MGSGIGDVSMSPPVTRLPTTTHPAWAGSQSAIGAAERHHPTLWAEVTQRVRPTAR